MTSIFKLTQISDDQSKEVFVEDEKQVMNQEERRANVFSAKALMISGEILYIISQKNVEKMAHDVEKMAHDVEKMAHDVEKMAYDLIHEANKNPFDPMAIADKAKAIADLSSDCIVTAKIKEELRSLVANIERKYAVSQESLDTKEEDGKVVTIEFHSKPFSKILDIPEIKAGTKFDLGQYSSNGKPIGRGGFGTVYVIEDANNNKRLALKVENIVKKTGWRNQKEREKLVLERFHHDKLLKTFCFIETKQQILQVMELAGNVDGTGVVGCNASLASWNFEHNKNCKDPLFLECCQMLFKDVGEGLQYLHDHNFIHRDIKEANILFMGEKVVIADFGLVREGPGDTVLGTEGYMAPEITKKKGPYTSAVDMYALGVSIYRILWKRLHPEDRKKLESRAIFLKDVEAIENAKTPPLCAENRKFNHLMGLIWGLVYHYHVKRLTAEYLLGHPFLCEKDIDQYSLIADRHHKDTNIQKMDRMVAYVADVVGLGVGQRFQRERFIFILQSYFNGCVSRNSLLQHLRLARQTIPIDGCNQNCLSTPGNVACLGIKHLKLKHIVREGRDNGTGVQ